MKKRIYDHLIFVNHYCRFTISMVIILNLSANFVLGCNSSDTPVGHGDTLGKHRPSDGHIDILTSLPSPQDFWLQYASQRKPALFKGAALRFPAMKLWTDSYLIDYFGSLEVKLEHKFEKKDVPIGERGRGRDTIKSFVKSYQASQSYIVSQLPDPMSKNISLLPFLTCGSFYERLLESNLWLSSGGSKSLLHRDADNAFNCLLNGTKDWILIDPKHEDKIPIAEGDSGFGGFATLDVDKVNLLKYQKFRDVPWQYANVSSGDCLFLPYGYWHQVRSYGAKNMAVSILFSRLKTFNASGCDKPLDYVSLNDTNMVWTYSGYGAQTLGNPDPFEIKDGFAEFVKRRKKIGMKCFSTFYDRSLNQNEMSSGAEKEKANAQAKELFDFFDKDKNGLIEEQEVRSSPVSLWKQIISKMDEDPANSDSYEFYTLHPEDVRKAVLSAIDETKASLAEDDLLRIYSKLGGSERWGKELYQNLKGNWAGETIPKDIVLSNLEEQLNMYSQRENDAAGEFYRKEQVDDLRIMGISSSDLDERESASRISDELPTEKSEHNSHSEL